MCGMIGAFTPGRTSRHDWMRPDDIAHRGPDDEGFIALAWVRLHHRRLAIFDTSSDGHQPFNAGTLFFAFNGAIYNFKDLRSELANLGHRFTTCTDTEVVARAWMEWGDACVQHFNGMFAICVVDTLRQTVTLARDKWGIKPLYFTVIAGGWAWASEAQALRRANGPPAINEGALAQYLVLQNIWGGETLFAGVTEVPAASIVRMTERGVSTETWWRAAWHPDPTMTLADAAAEMRSALTRAVARQSEADVPVGALLSGGLDSGAIVALGPPGRRTFTVGWADETLMARDERRSAAAVAHAAGAEHFDVVLTAGHLARLVPATTAAMDVPRVGQCYPDFAALEMASRYVKVVQSGVGADELLGGYKWRLAQYMMSGGFSAYWMARFGWYGGLATLLRDGEAGARVEADVMAFADGICDGAGAEMGSHDGHMLVEMASFLPGLLTVADRLSMRHGIEARVPFLDDDVVNVALRIPASVRLDGAAGKPVLRAAMAGVLPRDVIDAPKQGFAAPDDVWFRGPEAAGVLATLGPDASVWSMLDRAGGLRVIDDHVSGRANRRLAIWSLLSLEAWMGRWL